MFAFMSNDKSIIFKVVDLDIIVLTSLFSSWQRNSNNLPSTLLLLM